MGLYRRIMSYIACPSPPPAPSAVFLHDQDPHIHHIGVGGAGFYEIPEAVEKII